MRVVTSPLTPPTSQLAIAITACWELLYTMTHVSAALKRPPALYSGDLEQRAPGMQLGRSRRPMTGPLLGLTDMVAED